MKRPLRGGVAAAMLSATVFAAGFPVRKDSENRKFSDAPPVGAHPRVLVSDSDRFRLRAAIQRTACGRIAAGRSEEFIAMAIGEGKPLKACYCGLVAGEADALDRISAAHEWWRGEIPQILLLLAVKAWLDDDVARGVNVGKALRTYFAVVRDSNKDLPSKVYQLALAYDFGAKFFQADDREAIRGLIAQAIRGRKIFGAAMPARWCDHNWIPRGTELVLSALSIEGEEGFDSRIVEEGVGVLQNFLRHGLSANGVPFEDMHYFHYGMDVGSMAMVALARRGVDLFREPRYRKVATWYLQAAEPFGGAFSMHDDTPDDKGGLLGNYCVMKWIWPSDRQIDFTWRSRMGVDYSAISSGYGILMPLLFPSDWKPESDAAVRGSMQERSGILGGLETTFLDEERGLWIARSDWSPQALVVHATWNANAVGPSHAHADCGNFTLSALGRKWAIDRGYHINTTDQHSCVLIDGKGQGYFAAPGRLIDHTVTSRSSSIELDLEYAYHWQYMWARAIPPNEKTSGGWVPERRSSCQNYWAEGVSTDFRSRPWEDTEVASSYTFKREWNPLKCATRSFTLKRGGSGKLTIQDVIEKKETGSVTYEWRMQVADDLFLERLSDTSGLLRPIDAKDRRLLRVEVVRGGEEGHWTLESIPLSRQDSEGKKSPAGWGKCLVFRLRAEKCQLMIDLEACYK